MANIGKLFRSAGTYFLGNVLTRLISFFLLPIYTQYIAKGDLGYFDVSTTYLNVLVPVLCLEVWAGVMRYMFDFERREEKYAVIFNGMVIFTGSVAVYTLLFCLLGVITDIRCALLIFFYGVLLMLQNLYTYLARGLGYSRAFAVSGIVSGLVNSLSNIVMIVAFGMRLESLYLAMILGLLAQMLILESRVKILRNIRFSMFDAGMIGSMIRFSLPLCLNSACFWFLSSYNKVGISQTLGLEANGIYTVAGKFTMMVAIVANCFSLAWQEMVYSLGNEESNKTRLYSTATNYCITFLLFGELFIIPAVHVIFPFFVDPAYHAAYSLVPLYMFATAISTFCSFLGNIFGAEKRTRVVFYSAIAGAVVNVAVFHALVGIIGLEAANIGLALGYVINIVVRLIVLKRAYPIRLQWGRILFVLLLNVPVFYVYLTQGLWANIATCGVIGIIMLIMFRDTLKAILGKLRR